MFLSSVEKLTWNAQNNWIHINQMSNKADNQK